MTATLADKIFSPQEDGQLEACASPLYTKPPLSIVFKLYVRAFCEVEPVSLDIYNYTHSAFYLMQHLKLFCY